MGDRGEHHDHDRRRHHPLTAPTTSSGVRPSRCSPMSRSFSATRRPSATIAAQRAPAFDGRLELLAELAARGVRTHAQPGVPKRRRDGQAARQVVVRRRPPPRAAAGPAARRPAPPWRGSSDPGRSRSRSPASDARRGARPARRSGLRRRAPAAAPRVRRRRTRTRCACSSPARGPADGRRCGAGAAHRAGRARRGSARGTRRTGGRRSSGRRRPARASSSLSSSTRSGLTSRRRRESSVRRSRWAPKYSISASR